MNDPKLQVQTKAIITTVADLFVVETVARQNDKIILSLNPRGPLDKCTKLLEDRLDYAGYSFSITNTNDTVVLEIAPARKLKIPPTNLVLFILTLLSVYFMPVLFRNLAKFSALSDALAGTMAELAKGAGIEFTVAMVSILLIHEMGHYIASRRRNIITSWPYFIPAPNLIGTFGAVIKSKSPFWNRRDLIEVGAAGPIAGWVVAIGWLLYGLSQSTIGPVEMFGPGEWGFSLDGESILMRGATLLILGPAPEGHFFKLTEAAFAGWVGMLVTAINMLPIGQLDGGHVLYGLFQKKQHALGRAAMVALLVLGFYSKIWWVFAAMGLFFGVKHPPTLGDGRPLTRSAKFMGWAAILIFALSLTPIPFP